MALLPKVKLKSVVSFPAHVNGGNGIDVEKQNGTYTIDLDYSEFGLTSELPTSTTSRILTYDTATNRYVMMPTILLGGAGIGEAPADHVIYGRKDGGWTPAGAGGGGTPSNTNPIMAGVAAPGVATAYARGDHVHPTDTSRASVTYVDTQDNLKAPLASPTFTGSPQAPTPTPSSDSTTKLATTAFVQAAVSAVAGGVPIASTDGYLLQTRGVGSGAPIWTGYQQTGASAVVRTWADKARERPTVRDFGAVPDGTTSANAAIAATIAAPFSTIIFPEGTYRISASTTWVAGKTYIFMPGAKLTVDALQTLTIRGEVQAPKATPIFTGAGAVVGIRCVTPEWFGAANNGSTDDLAALNKCYACVAASASSVGDMMEIVLLPGSGYFISATWLVYVTAAVPLRVRGGSTGNTRIVAAPSINAVIIAGEVGGGVTADLHFHDFAIQASSAAGVGLYVGAGGRQIQGYQNARIENLQINGFQYGMYIVNARMIDFKRIGIWMGAVSPGFGIMIQPEANLTYYTADMTFETIQIVPSYPTDSQYDIYINAVAGANGVAGLKFLHCTLYRASTAFIQFSADTKDISDIWFTNTQIDGTTVARPVSAATANGGRIYAVHFSHTYIQGPTGAFFNLDAGNPAGISDWSIIGGFFSGGTNGWIYGNNVYGLACEGIAGRGHQIGNELFKFNNCSSISVSNNVVRSYASEQTPYFVTLTGSTDSVSICNNSCDNALSVGVLNDSSSGNVKNIYGNGKFTATTVRLPDGKMMMWGFNSGGATSGSPTITVSFPTPFKAAPLVTATMMGAVDTVTMLSVAVDSIGTANFRANPRYNTASGSGVAGQGFNWTAIGVAA